jgi:hypothetical protein
MQVRWGHRLSAHNSPQIDLVGSVNMQPVDDIPAIDQSGHHDQQLTWRDSAGAGESAQDRGMLAEVWLRSVTVSLTYRVYRASRVVLLR